MALKPDKKPVKASLKTVAAKPATGASKDKASRRVPTKEGAKKKSSARKPASPKTEALAGKRPASRSQTPLELKATRHSMKGATTLAEKTGVNKTATASKTKALSRTHPSAASKSAINTACSPKIASKSAIDQTSAPSPMPAPKPAPASKSTSLPAPKSAPTAKPSQKPTLSPAPMRAGRVTKQERVLALLRQSKGASLDDIVAVTDWRIHSIRGFLAGTVKKKLGYELSSARGADTVRRYKIPARPALR